MDDGDISISAYDTAWVGLVEDVHGSGTPQFPSSLQWIATNQLPDGSWGDCEIFSAHDRILNTLACVVALKSWNIHPDKCHKGTLYICILCYWKNPPFFSFSLVFFLLFVIIYIIGMEFFKENLSRLENENAEHMPIGFEVAFPSLLEMARKIDLHVPNDSPVLQDIYAKRDLKLKRYIASLKILKKK